MPTLQLKTHAAATGGPAGGARAQARALSTDLLGKRHEVTAVVIEELWPGRWFVGGRNPREATALLEIRITRERTTPAEKEAFIAAAYEELEQQLGPLEEASYVVVQEMAASDWGYGGRTQAARKSRTPAL
jgi:4-oxalocrotonate tautomerase